MDFITQNTAIDEIRKHLEQLNEFYTRQNYGGNKLTQFMLKYGKPYYMNADTFNSPRISPPFIRLILGGNMKCLIRLHYQIPEDLGEYMRLIPPANTGQWNDTSFQQVAQHRPVWLSYKQGKLKLVSPMNPEAK